MHIEAEGHGRSSGRWRIAVLAVFILGFTALIWITVTAYKIAPPIPILFLSPSGERLFSAEDIAEGQEIFLRHGLMDNGSIWGHGAYLGPDFSAEYLHALGLYASELYSLELFNTPLAQLEPFQREIVNGRTTLLLKENRYDEKSGILQYTSEETLSFNNQLGKWKDYFAEPALNRGLLLNQVSDSEELRKLTSFFAWTAWASVANRPGENYSYTNNFPYEPAVGNRPTSNAILWSALSIITLLGGTALVLFAFGRFKFLGWKPAQKYSAPEFVPLANTPGQKAVIKFFFL